NDLATKMYDNEVVGLRYAAEANIQMLASTRSIRNALISYSAADRLAYLKGMDERLANVKRQMAGASTSFMKPEGKLLFDRTQAAFAEYEEAMREPPGCWARKNWTTSVDRPNTCSLWSGPRPINSII
ncbi:MAG: MCP four helix bundle domain-containing protein, partial [Pseudomonadota bacterium]|nr:MCP four helix bundle domain-containing protein [Pseudomonadota bacterium]